MERWLPVGEYEGFYEVSSRGQVHSLDRTVVTRSGPRRYKGQPLAWYINPGGYPMVTLSAPGRGQVDRPVHQLVLEAFVGPCPPGQEVRHLNDIKTDCGWPENLAYGTRRENFADRAINGIDNRGERNGATVTTSEVVLEVRRRAEDGEKQSDLAAEYGLTRANVWAIVHRKSWDWI